MTKKSITAKNYEDMTSEEKRKYLENKNWYYVKIVECISIRI